MSSKSVAHKATYRILGALFRVPRKSYYDLHRELNFINGYQLMRYLRKNELLEEVITKKGTFYQITAKGKKKLLKAELDNINIEKPKKWDGKWRIVIFDIPEKHKIARNYLATKLRELGFKQVQKSVYLIPYECTEEIERIRCYYQIRDYVLIITTTEIERADKLKKLFNLSK
jgi:DNA-binding transcriptional regulator PaaX